MKKFSLLSVVLLIAASFFLEGCCCVPCPIVYEESTPLDSPETELCWHDWQSATCTSPSVCILCGETRGGQIDHLIINSFCVYCGEKFDTDVDVESESEDGSEGGLHNPGIEIGDPGEYSYFECDQVVYVNNSNGITLRSASYEAMGSVKHGAELRRIAISNDESNYWSKVIYEDEEYYVASKFLTEIDPKNADEGFVEIEKTVVVNDETGSLNIRDLPSLDGSQVIGWAIAGTEYKVVAENTETGWYKIEFIPYGSDEITYGYITSSANHFVE